MSSALPRLSEANESAVAFLLIEVDTAMTFMDVASATTIEETARHCYQNAVKAYKVVVRLLQSLNMNPWQRQTIEEKLAQSKARQDIEEKLAQLRARLDGAGYQV